MFQEKELPVELQEEAPEENVKNHKEDKEDKDMTVSGIGTDTTMTSQLSTTRLAENFDTFLTLLTEQLKNQDPLEPLKTNEFTQQLVQFSNVEQSIAQNRSLETLVALTQASVTGSAVSFLGRDVEAVGNIANLKDGEATWAYGIARQAHTVTLTVRDAGGGIVYETEGEAEAGLHTLEWDGTDNSGQQLPDGYYTLSIEALDTADNTITTQTRVTGRVTGIDFSGSEPILTVNGLLVPLGNVQTLSEPAGDGA